MNPMHRLIEPQGILFGAAAQRAVAAGVALPLAGGPAAFTLATLIEGTRYSDPIPVDRIPSGWREVLERITARPPACGLADVPMVMGILNVTPDSFSDGGRHAEAEAAIAAGQRMAAEGAGILDIGAESTRPGSASVSPAEEWQRLEPVLAGLRDGLPISVDTRNASTMAAVLNAGATLINDVSALEYDPDARALLAERDCGIVLMHMRGTPDTMNDLAVYDDVAVEMVRELAERVAQAVRAGIAPSRLLVDPGIGFAKTTGQNCEVMARLPLLANLGCRVLLGVSRKRMIGALTGIAEPARRDPGTIAATLPGLALGATLLRVHDVPGMVQAVQVSEGFGFCAAG